MGSEDGGDELRRDGGARWREGGGGWCAPPLAAGSDVLLAGCRGEGGDRAGGEVEVRDGSGGGVAEADDDGREVWSDP